MHWNVQEEVPEGSKTLKKVLNFFQDNIDGWKSPIFAKKSNFWDQEIDVPVRTRKAHFMGAGSEANTPEVYFYTPP